MGMDVYGNSGNYFRANIWSWRAILRTIELAGHGVDPEWTCNNGAGFDDQEECDALAEQLEAFLASWDGDEMEVECSTMRVDSEGRFVSPDTPGGRSPYRTSREHLQCFIEFLRECDGFAIH